jgi:hypothetical protein
MGIKDWIFPQSRIFYDLFERLATTVKKGSDELVVLAENYAD